MRNANEHNISLCWKNGIKRTHSSTQIYIYNYTLEWKEVGLNYALIYNNQEDM